VRYAGDHIADQSLSAFIDDQLAPDAALQAQTHLETCSVCRVRLDELQSLVDLLHRLPSLEPPRDFSIGPRLVADPPNVVRLRRWYGVVRAGAATLAAAFVFLSAGALYVNSQPAASSGLSSRSQVASAPAAPLAASPAVRSAAPAAAAPPAPVPSGPGALADAAPAGVSAPARAASASTPSGIAPGGAGAPAPSGAAPGGAAAAAARSQPAPGDDLTDQVTAATSARPLPTLAPTAVPVPTQAPPRIAQQPFAVATVDPAAPLRTAAAIVGLLAVFGLLATLVVRHRLRAASISPTE